MLPPANAPQTTLNSNSYFLNKHAYLQRTQYRNFSYSKFVRLSTRARRNRRLYSFFTFYIFILVKTDASFNFSHNFIVHFHIFRVSGSGSNISNQFVHRNIEDSVRKWNVLNIFLEVFKESWNSLNSLNKLYADSNSCQY